MLGGEVLFHVTGNERRLPDHLRKPSTHFTYRNSFKAATFPLFVASACLYF